MQLLTLITNSDTKYDESSKTPEIRGESFQKSPEIFLKNVVSGEDFQILKNSRGEKFLVKKKFGGEILG